MLVRNTWVLMAGCPVEDVEGQPQGIRQSSSSWGQAEVRQQTVQAAQNINTHAQRHRYRLKDWAKIPVLRSRRAYWGRHQAFETSLAPTIGQIFFVNSNVADPDPHESGTFAWIQNYSSGSSKK